MERMISAALNRIIWTALPLACWMLSCSRSEPAEEGWLNHDPSVAYTGKQACASCHEDIAGSFALTGMGRSFYKPQRATAIERFDPPQVVHDASSGYSYHPFWKGDSLFLLEFRLSGGDTVYRRLEVLDFVVGSGHQTRSYVLNRKGYYYEAPITWYVQAQKWDLSPGYEGGHNSRFSREIGLECMACHNSRPGFDPATSNYFTSVGDGIGCESCHGPGALHVKRMQAGEEVDVGAMADPSIVNPARLPVQLQFDVCMQCHLQGFNVYQPGKSILDFRPGMALRQIMDVVVEQSGGENEFGIASHAQRLMESNCFVKSGGKLTCTTCHDPHHAVKETPALVHASKCGTCHKEGAVMCSAPAAQQQAAGGNCAGCHMPRGGTSDIPHVTFTDHKIRVVKPKAAPDGAELVKLYCATQKNPPDEVMARAWLLYYERNSPDASVLKKVEGKLGPDQHYEKAALLFYESKFDQALEEVKAAEQARPDDAFVLFRKGEILEALGRMEEAQAAFERIYARHPQVTEAGLKAGVLRIKNSAGNPTVLGSCEMLFKELMQKKPHEVKIIGNLGFVQMNLGRFAEAEALFRRALALEPDYLLARENLIMLLAHQGRKADARLEMGILLGKFPDYPKKMVLEGMLRD